jgi:hypothetical protein
MRKDLKEATHLLPLQRLPAAYQLLQSTISRGQLENRKSDDFIMID